MKNNWPITHHELTIFKQRTHIANSEIGALALTLAFSCVGLDAPRVFAFASMAIVIFWMSYRLRGYDRVYRLWREVDHPFTKARYVWRRFSLFNIGWTALGLVASGLVGKHGVLGF
jgi:hypothetical protein